MHAAELFVRRGVPRLACRSASPLRRSRCTTVAAAARHASSMTPPPTSPLRPDTAASAAASPSASTTSAPHTFRSATNFKLAPAQVNEGNVPTAAEVAAMIPTLRELRAQLPDARALEQRYIQPMAVDAAADTTGAASMTPGIFQKTTDPLEDLLFGPPKEEAAAAAATDAAAAPPARRQHLLLAYQALLWGTVYAVLGFAATVALAMYGCGYGSLAALMDGVRGKMGRDEDRLRASVDVGDGAVVEHYVIDLTHPTEAWRQVQEAWTAVQRLAEEEDAKAGVPSTP